MNHDDAAARLTHQFHHALDLVQRRRRPPVRQLYTKAANQERLARQAIEQLSAWEASPPDEREDEMAKPAMAALEAWRSIA
jgi:hypothetical protein